MSSEPRRGGGEREVSAGGVLVRDGEVVVIVPRRRAADGSRVLALPKGHPEPGETMPEAARREVREETGIDGEPGRELGQTRYSYRRGRQLVGKSVTFYLFSYLAGDTVDHDSEVEEARWMDLREARAALTYPAERDIVGRALACLEEGRKDR